MDIPSTGMSKPSQDQTRAARGSGLYRKPGGLQGGAGSVNGRSGRLAGARTSRSAHGWERATPWRSCAPGSSKDAPPEWRAPSKDEEAGLEARAPARLEAEIGLAHAIIVQKLATRTGKLDAAVLQDVAAMGDLERGHDILLDQ